MTEHRPGLSAFLALAGFLLFAPAIFLAGPLAAILAVSPAESWWERIWLVGSVAIIVAGLSTPGAIDDQFISAAGLGLTGATLAVAMSARKALVPPFRQTVTAVTAAAIGTVSWAAVLGLNFDSFQTAVATRITVATDALFNSQAASDNPAATEMLESMRRSAELIASLYPGFLITLALAGSMLAWVWAHRLTTHPPSVRPQAFRAFRFNDHMIWGAIITFAVVLAPVSGNARLVAANVLVVWIAVYAARGLAVVASFLSAAPTLLKWVTAIFGVLLQPFSSGALLAMGLADTWIDFRRRPPPANGDAAI